MQQGRTWLQEGEPPTAVLQETEDLLQTAADNRSKAAWKLVAAEAHLRVGDAVEAIQSASQAMVLFEQLKLREEQMAASAALIDALVLKQDGAAAADAAESAAAACREADDVAGEAAMLLRKSEALLAAMQAGDARGDASALEAAARAHLLYDPEQAIKAAKEALAIASAAGDISALPRIERSMIAAKAQVATAQQAEQAKALSCRGQAAPAYKWPKVLQLRAPAAPDVFAMQERPRAEGGSQLAVRGASAGPVGAAKIDTKPAVAFTRKPFKWNPGYHKTDEAWYRQELTYLPPSGE